MQVSVVLSGDDMELRNEMSGLGGLSEKASLSHEAESLCEDEIGVDSRMMGCCGSEESNTSSRIR